MKNESIIILLVLFLTTSCGSNKIYDNNKKVLDSFDYTSEYAFITTTGFESKNKSIDYKTIISNKIKKDGYNVEMLYSTRYQQTLIDDSLYFCYEYNHNNDIGNHALGYIDLINNEVHLGYFNYARYMFDYNFSTDKFVTYTFKENSLKEDFINIVFFKDTDTLEFDYDMTNLKYNQDDVEEVNIKDYYIENNVRYEFSNNNHTFINKTNNESVYLKYDNDMLESVNIVKDIYNKFVYDTISISATYISTGDELFFYIVDRPTNNLNAPFMVFKCNIDYTDVKYLGYTNNLIIDIVKINQN